MAWTSPMTATAGSAFTAADFNTFIRDNLNETAVAKATTAGRIFVSTGLNSLAERAVGNDSVNTNESTTSSGYTDLATFGPSVQVDTGPSALVFWSAQITAATAGWVAYCSVDITGATTTTASDNWALIHEVSAAADVVRPSMSYMFTGLNAGSNTFTLKYKVAGSPTPAASFQRRSMFVIPL